MAAEPLRYTSQKDAEQAAARLNAKDGGGWVIETRMEADNKTIWYVKPSPTLCPVRAVDLSTIPVAPWRSEVSNVRDRVNELWRPCVWWGIVFVASSGIEGALEHWGYTSISRWLFLPLTVFAALVFFWIAYQAGTIKKKVVGRHLYFKCECGQRIGTDIDWVCGECNYENEKNNGAWDSFLVECKKCHAPPAAFVCYHCGRVIPLIVGGDFRHPAHASDGHGENDKEDQLSERIAEAERQKQAFEKEIEALKAETRMAITAKEREEARIKLRETTSTDFQRRMN